MFGIVVSVANGYLNHLKTMKISRFYIGYFFLWITLARYKTFDKA